MSNPSRWTVTAVDEPQKLGKFQMQTTDYVQWLDGRMSPEQTFVAIVKLAEGAQMPREVEVRAAIGPALVTALVRARDFQRLQDDPAVVQVSLSQKLRLLDQPDAT